MQTIWGFDDGSGTRSPGPTYQAFYGTPQLTRNHNALPATTQVNNTGFGMPQVTTHLHNGHTPSESDGNPSDFYPAGKFCDQYHPTCWPGSTPPLFWSVTTNCGEVFAISCVRRAKQCCR